MATKYRPSKARKYLRVTRVVPDAGAWRVEFEDDLSVHVHGGHGRSDVLYAMRPSDMRHEGRAPGPETRRDYQYLALTAVLAGRQADFVVDHDGDVKAYLREQSPNARKSPAMREWERAKGRAHYASMTAWDAERADAPPERVAALHRAAVEAILHAASLSDALPGGTTLAQIDRENAEAHEQAIDRALGGAHAPNPLAPRQRRNASSDEINIANPSDAEEGKRLWRFWFGQVGSTTVYVWEDSEESAFETAVEWLDDNDYAGHFTTITQDDLKAAAEDEGIEWNPEWSDPRWADWDDPDFLKVVEAAEADLTLIGHTTLKHGTHLVSYEWGYSEVTDPKEYDSVLLVSQAAED